MGFPISGATEKVHCRWGVWWHALVKLGWYWAAFILGQGYYVKPYLAQPGRIGCYQRVWPYSRAQILPVAFETWMVLWAGETTSMVFACWENEEMKVNWLVVSCVFSLLHSCVARCAILNQTWIERSNGCGWLFWQARVISNISGLVC